MKTTGVSCETKFGLLVFLGHPSSHVYLSTCPPQINMEDPGFIDLMKEYYTVLVQKLFMIAVKDNMEYVFQTNSTAGCCR